MNRSKNPVKLHKHFLSKPLQTENLFQKEKLNQKEHRQPHSNKKRAEEMQEEKATKFPHTKKSIFHQTNFGFPSKLSTLKKIPQKQNPFSIFNFQVF